MYCVRRFFFLAFAFDSFGCPNLGPYLRHIGRFGRRELEVNGVWNANVVPILGGLIIPGVGAKDRP